LPHNLSREIDFIMRGPNAGAELNNEIGSARTEMLSHRLDSFRNDAKLGPLLPGMREADRTAHGIDKINGAAIAHVNPKANAALICDEAVAIFEAPVLLNCRIDNRDAISVDLLRGNERRGAKPMLRSDFPMNAVQSGERFRLLVRHLEAGDAQREAMHHAGQRTQRWELFGRKLAGVHLPEVVVRVVRVVVLICGGFRSPA
jgi:hypothetical protein